MTAPSLFHAIGNGAGGLVEIHPAKGLTYLYVSCENPHELVAAIEMCLGSDSFIKCDDGTYVQRCYVALMRVKSCDACDEARFHDMFDTRARLREALGGVVA